MQSKKPVIEAPMGTHYVTIDSEGNIKRVPYKELKVNWDEFNKAVEKINNANKKR